jgi:hypothetical protein
VRLAVQQLLGRTSVDDRAPHRPQGRAEQLAIGAGNLRVAGGVIDEELRLVDAIHEVWQPIAGHIRLPHASVQSLQRDRVLVRRDVARWHRFVVGPQCDREDVLLVDARLDPRIEHRQRGARLGETPSDLDFELGAVLPRARRDASEYVTRPKVHREPVRIVQHHLVIDGQTACGGHCGARSHRSRKLRCVHRRHSRKPSVRLLSNCS